MMLLMTYLMLASLIVSLMLIVNLILSKKEFKDREKSSSFECGFDTMVKNRLPFSLQFFLVSIVFLIFDIEIAVILPFTFTSLNNYFILVNSMNLILLLLLLGLIMEWWEGALNWMK
uniref:NADH dehydrogenase subunit 3 n=1 Tax=Lamennaisia ambigua TaxID=3064205 RepID=UPI00286BC0C4|nr:NADH dehydrogenase subunit 3 [Lamennaisia ambigua]WKV28899.1 NADH dehydrogenase subunit 3 [Lamennaisia ambigua]